MFDQISPIYPFKSQYQPHTQDNLKIRKTMTNSDLNP